MPWRDMALDSGWHIDAGISLEEAARMIQAEYEAEDQRRMEEQAAEDAAWEALTEEE